MVPQDVRQKISTRTMFERSIGTELLMWHENALTLELPRDISNRIATQELRRSIVGNVLLGCHRAGTFEELNKLDFSWQSLLKSTSRPAEKDSNSGIYASRYYNFKGDPAKKDVARVGSASVLATRVRSHIKHRTDSNWTSERTHLTQARQARCFEHRTICYIEDSCVRLIAEQVFVSLFELYSPTILDDDPATDRVFDGTAHESINDENEKGKTVDVSREAKTYSRVKAMCRINALQLLEISKRARTISKWVGGMSRPSFNASLGVNVSSPIFEQQLNYQPIRWSRCDIPGKCAAFTHWPNRVARHDKYIHWLTNIKGQALYSVIGENRPELGDMVYTQCEVMLDGSYHPHSYARLPDLQVWRDYALANTLGISVTWQDSNGVWRKAPITFSRNTYMEKDQDGHITAGVFKRYATALRLRRYLLHEQADQPHSWEVKLDLGFARVYQPLYEHWHNTITLRQIPVKVKRVARTKRATFQEVKEMLQAVGARFDREILSGENKVLLKQCDLCKIKRTTRSDRCSPELIDGFLICKECEARGTICTFTRDSSGRELVSTEDPVAHDVAQFISDKPLPEKAGVVIDNPFY